MKSAIFHLAFIYSGGGEKLVLEEARGLEKSGHQVTIFTPVLDKEKCFPDIIDQFDIKTFLPKLPTLIPQWEAFQILLVCVLIPLIAHRFKDFDVILAANQPSLWLAWVIKKLYHVPYVAYLAQPTRFLHPRKIDKETGLRFTGKGTFSPATYLLKVAKPLADWADRVSIKGADLVLANGKYVKGRLERTYGVEVVSCPAGAYPSGRIKKHEERVRGQITIGKKAIKKPYFRAQVRKEGGLPIKIGKPYILLTNRHFPQNRFEYAITALPTILKEDPNVSLVITGGETDYTENLKNLVRQLSLEDKVIFLELVTETELEKLYSQAAVYVYTAPEEDFGMGIVEAMAQGTPVVAWNAAGPSKIIKNGKTGLLAKPYEAADFVNKITWILADRKFARKIGKQAWEDVKKNFSYQTHVKVLEKSFNDTLKARK